MAYIEASNISKSFESASGRRHVLERVSLSVDRGEFVSIVGFMGCGKSTLLNTLAGVTRPDSGEIRVEGRPIAGVNERASIVFQNYSLLPWFSALENVRLAVRAARRQWSRAEQLAQAERYLVLVVWEMPCIAGQISFRAACGSAWRSRERLPPSRNCCSSTSPLARSTR